MRAWSPWRGGGPHLVVQQRGCRWSRRKGLWCCWTCFSSLEGVIWRDAACPAKDCNRPDTAHISLTAIALCDLHRTMLQSELLYIPVGLGQTRSTRSFGSAADGYVRGKALPAPRGCQRLGRVGSANQPP